MKLGAWYCSIGPVDAWKVLGCYVDSNGSLGRFFRHTIHTILDVNWTKSLPTLDQYIKIYKNLYIYIGNADILQGPWAGPGPGLLGGGSAGARPRGHVRCLHFLCICIDFCIFVYIGQVLVDFPSNFHRCVCLPVRLFLKLPSSFRQVLYGFHDEKNGQGFH